MKALIFLQVVITCLLLANSAAAQQEVLVPDLSKISDSGKWTAFNRNILFDNHVQMNAKPGDGLLYLKDLDFSNGKIEFDVKGKEVFQKSFVGIAFHGIDEKTFDAIYFRPFNFKNPQRNSHSVQYISMPGNDWEKLRQEFPGKYENTVSPVPDPTDWFHVTVVISYPEVKVFVNNSAEPSLVVNQISQQKRGWLGFWVGNGSDGAFKNLKVTFSK